MRALVAHHHVGASGTCLQQQQATMKLPVVSSLSSLPQSSCSISKTVFFSILLLSNIILVSVELYLSFGGGGENAVLKQTEKNVYSPTVHLVLNTSTSNDDAPRIVWFHMDGSVETPSKRRRKWHNERRQRQLYNAKPKTNPSSFMQRVALPQSLLETPRMPRVYEPTAVVQRNETKLRRNLWLETDKNCEPQHEWQTTFHPTCNDMHELDLTDLTLPLANTRVATMQNTSYPTSTGASRFYVVATGGVRQAWSFKVSDFGTSTQEQEKQQRLALKMTRYTLELSEVNFISHQIDATISERLSASKNIVDIYNFCGNSALHEFAHDDLHNHVKMLGRRERLERQKSKGRGGYTSFTALERLQLAIDTATALADFHSIDSGQEDRPSVAHTDLIDKQMISIVGENGDIAWKLNDFNRARYIYQNKETRELCPYTTIGGFIGDLRAPEEFIKDRPSPQTAKVDIYTLGNILYGLTFEPRYPKMHPRDAQVKIIAGELPSPPKIHNKDDIVGGGVNTALYDAAVQCWTYKATERPTARQIESLLREKLAVVQAKAAAAAEKSRN